MPKRLENKDLTSRTSIFIATVFTAAKRWEQSEYLSMDKRWYIHTGAYYPVIKRKDVLITCYDVDEPQKHPST